MTGTLVLCRSTCRVADRCQRNERCGSSLAAKEDETVVFADWHPSGGAACPGFIDQAKPQWWRR